MTHPAFDAAGFAVFNLETGEIRSREDEKLALIPIDVIAELTPGEGLDKATRAWGEIHGKRLRQTIAHDNSPGLELLANHIGGALAVFGLGKGSMEIRGNALLFKVQTGSKSALVSLIPGFLGGFLAALRPQSPFQVIHLESNSDGDLFWVGSPKAIAKMKRLLIAGIKPLDALDKLAAGGS